jgi:hypothetical protein
VDVRLPTRLRAEISSWLGVPLVLGLAVLSIPCGLVAYLWIAVRERRLFRRLARRAPERIVKSRDRAARGRELHRFD